MAPRATTPPHQEGDVGGREDDTAKSASESKLAIERVLSCEAQNYEEILGVKKDANVEEKCSAFERIAVLVHAKVAHNAANSDAQKAFQRVITAAKKLDIDDATIATVEEWSGEGDLRQDDDDDDTGSEKNAAPKTETVEEPPESVKELYVQATPHMDILRENPDDKDAFDALSATNAKIMEITTEKMTEIKWEIDCSWFCPHYKIAKGQFEILASNSKESELFQAAAKKLGIERDLFHAYLKSRHLPMEWIIPTVAEYRQGRQDGTHTNTKDKSGEKSGEAEYPWATAKTPDGVCIVGVRKQGRTFKLTTDRVEDGRNILMQETLSEAGMAHQDVMKLYEEGNLKDLAEGQKDWKSSQASDFESLVKCSKAVYRRRNAANKYPANPSIDCVVKFKSLGLQVLCYSSLRRVLGKRRAEDEVGKACKRDGIAPPWDAPTWVLYNDPVAVEKDPLKRRELRREQERANPGRGGASQAKLEELEAGQANLIAVVGQLKDLVMKLSAKA